MWTEKYKPISLKDIVGQDAAVRQVKTFVDSFNNRPKKVLLIIGPSGSGKTSLVHAVAHDDDLELVEMGASDTRDANNLSSKVGTALSQRSLFSKGKLILLDDIDALSGSGDRGGLPALLKVMETSSFPIILTATDMSDFKFSTLKRKCEMCMLPTPDSAATLSFISSICKKEKITISEETIATLFRRSGNDFRATLNDLQSLGSIIEKSSLAEISDRNHTDKLSYALMKILKTTDFSIALEALDTVDADQNELMLWMDQNMPQEYTDPVVRELAYDHLSKADRYVGRIRRWQYWRFLVYINAHLAGGVALSKEKKFPSVSYSPPGRLLKVYWANQRLSGLKDVGRRMKSHTSLKTWMKKDLPFIKEISRSKSNSWAEEYKISAEELILLKK